EPGGSAIAISPDGTQLVYVADGQLYLRTTSDFESRAIPGTNAAGPPTNPVFSPDGHSIAFIAQGDMTLKRVSTSGGAPQTICGAPGGSALAWQASGFVFTRGGGRIWRCPSNGGEHEEVSAVAPGEVARWPQLLPSSSSLLFSVRKGAI